MSSDYSQDNGEQGMIQGQIGDNYYEVEKILNRRIGLNLLGIEQLQYKVKWKGYPDPKDYTWEPIQHLLSVKKLVQEFDRKFELRKSKLKRSALSVTPSAERHSEHSKTTPNLQKTIDADEKPRKLHKMDQEQRQKKAEKSRQPVKEKASALEMQKGEKRQGLTKSQVIGEPAQRGKAEEGILGRVVEHRVQSSGKCSYECEKVKNGRVIGRVLLSSEEAQEKCPASLCKYLEQLMVMVEEYNRGR